MIIKSWLFRYIPKKIVFGYLFSMVDYSINLELYVLMEKDWHDLENLALEISKATNYPVKIAHISTIK